MSSRRGSLSADVRDSELLAALKRGTAGDGEVGYLLTLVARDLDLPAPVQLLGSGLWGTAWTTTHPRQVLKLTRDTWEMATWQAVRQRVIPVGVRRHMAGCVHVEVMQQPACWVCPGWHTRNDTNRDPMMCDCPSLAIIWKERVDQSSEPISRYIETPPAELRESVQCDIVPANNGVRGNRVKRVVTFDGRILPQTLLQLYKLEPKAKRTDHDDNF